ncbi:hypothetical protein LTR78_009572 [Recurvomyces mirabilis]|uniref:FAD dependent oxidoreductase domain-containing protein n=1 Tax=Recurvomyces mirabilis TaxID=574656 RepID=A0AAE0TNN1_9PEZI|nr:hypothetical protein LTR78_009572 [Recurvomyces mirabilis]KAK5149973.1 hypothetical protein LTS14_010445 [Recurvomyces mirabilis]
MSAMDRDPGLPVKDPTTPHWQIPLHPLANLSSPQLPEDTDVLIIGSGITGCSVAKTLLQSDHEIRVTVLEARGLASGASSRNGGHIISPCFSSFDELVSGFGVETAVELALFSERNIDKTFEAAAEYDGLVVDSKIRRTEKVLAFRDQEKFDHIKTVLNLWNEHMPADHQNPFRLVDPEEARTKCGMQNVAGLAIGRAAAAWPYRLWTGIWSNLCSTYGDRLFIETHTPAQQVSELKYDGQLYRYTVGTPRGSIKTTHVVYCTNGYTSHLLPSLRGKLFPVRGTMSAQELGNSVPNLGAHRSWSFDASPYQDPETEAVDPGLYYLTQDPDSGYMMLGGEYDRPEVIISSDDSKINPISAEKILDVLPRHFVGAKSPIVKDMWSGIMGFVRDGLPLIGSLPKLVTGRPGKGEWIGAGFNGYGTGYCLSCGEAIAEMILGRDVSNGLPSVLLLTEDRFDGSLVSQNVWSALTGKEERSSSRSSSASAIVGTELR